MLYDVEAFEVRFECAGSRKMRPPSLRGSGFYRKIVMLCAAGVRLDCAGSRKISRCGVVLSELSARAVLQ